MDFQTSIRTVLSKYATFTGRASRSEFWWFALFAVIVNIVTSIIDSTILGASLLNVISSLGLLLPQLAVGARRLHDIDRSGWWLLIALIPIIGWIVLIYFNVQPSQQGANRFGPQPTA